MKWSLSMQNKDKDIIAALRLVKTGWDENLYSQWGFQWTFMHMKNISSFSS
jgi:hypothetical protein